MAGHKDGPAPEAVLDSLITSPAPLGYAGSKFLGELLVGIAAHHFQSFLSATIIRVGQVAGPVLGPDLWNLNEWFPSMILSSLHLGMVPDSLGLLFDNVNFVPVDLLADALVDLATTASVGEARTGARVFNLRNPTSTPWSALLPAASEAVEPHLQVVPPEMWLARLRSSSDARLDDDDATNNPAVKLIDFFTGLWTPGTDKAVGAMTVDDAIMSSPTLRNLESMKPEWLRKWVEEWTAKRIAR